MHGAGTALIASQDVPSARMPPSAHMSVRVEQAQDGGDHDGLLAGRHGAEQVVAGAVPGNADDLAAGGLDGA